MVFGGVRAWHVYMESTLRGYDHAWKSVVALLDFIDQRRALSTHYLTIVEWQRYTCTYVMVRNCTQKSQSKTTQMTNETDLSDFAEMRYVMI